MRKPILYSIISTFKRAVGMPLASRNLIPKSMLDFHDLQPIR